MRHSLTHVNGIVVWQLRKNINIDTGTRFSRESSRVPSRTRNINFYALSRMDRPMLDLPSRRARIKRRGIKNTLSRFLSPGECHKRDIISQALAACRESSEA